MAELRLHVAGISCGNCVNAVETALRDVEGVASATVGLDGASIVTLSAGCEAAERQADVVATVEAAGKAATVTSTVQPNPSAVSTPRQAAPPVLELVEPEPVLQLVDPDEDEDEDDGAGVGFAKQAPAKRASAVDVGVDGSTPKEVRVIGEGISGGGGGGGPALDIEEHVGGRRDDVSRVAHRRDVRVVVAIPGGQGK